MRKHWALGRVAGRQARREVAELAGRFGFFALLLVVFSNLWEVAAESDHTLGLEASTLLWYLAITEWIALSAPDLYLTVESDARRGDIAPQLVLPMGYLERRLSEATGRLLVRQIAIGVPGFALATLLAGGLPPSSAHVFAVLPFGVAAGLLTLFFHALIGLTAVWLGDATPLYWVWQKLAFVVGGLILPLSIYPVAVRGAFELTPFAALFYNLGRFAMRVDVETILRAGVSLAVWLAMIGLLLFAVTRAATRRLRLEGGAS